MLSPVDTDESRLHPAMEGSSKVEVTLQSLTHPDFTRDRLWDQGCFDGSSVVDSDHHGHFLHKFLKRLWM